MTVDRIAKSSDWKTKTFARLIPLPYRAAFSHSEMARLKQGLIPSEMEDKWFIYFENDVLYFHRSWTGFGAFQVHFENTEGGAKVSEAYGASETSMSEKDAAFSASLVSYLIDRTLLGKDISFPKQ